jgi:UDP-GlcNAc:undecaprenyl-phosphate/decaprenyl-phosphate GlcNAc-1-phosphate transferase
MSLWQGLLYAGIAAFFAFVVAAAGSVYSLRAPIGTNHRGERIPLSIGLALAWGYGVLSVLAALHIFDSGEAATAWQEWLWLLVAMAIVYASGLWDDLQSSRVHGVRAHFKALGRGRVTSGIVKLVAGLTAAAIAVLAAGARGWSLTLAIPLIAGVANLCNLFDVAPGRALKFGFCFAVGLILVRPSLLPWAIAGMTAALLPLDVRERAMLGDAGANLLGFVLGYLLWARLSVAGMAIALGVVLLLHVTAETVTLTRIIRATPPLRWLDDLWRIPASDPSLG